MTPVRRAWRGFSRGGPQERVAFLLSLGVAELALLVPFVGKGAWGLAAASLSVGGLWAVGHLRGLSVAHGGFLGFLTLGALGTLLGWKEPMLIGTVAALAAWDLDRFARRLRSVGRVEDREGLWALHLRRLLPTLGVGLLLGGIALEGRIALGLWGAILLGGLGFWGIAQLLRWLRSLD